MSKERYNQIIDEAYENFRVKVKDTYFPVYRTKEEFIDTVKNYPEFSKKWGIQIEERELSLSERIKLAGYDYEDRGGIGYNMLKETVDMDNTIPRQAITITYNNETVEVYEN